MGWNEELMNEGTNYVNPDDEFIDSWLEEYYEDRDTDYLDADGDDLYYDFVEEDYLNDQADREAHRTGY
jgi:hypothetical protein